MLDRKNGNIFVFVELKFDILSKNRLNFAVCKKPKNLLKNLLPTFTYYSGTQEKEKVEGLRNIWDKVFKNGPSKICGRQPLKNVKGYGLLGPFLNTLSHLRLIITSAILYFAGVFFFRVVVDVFYLSFPIRISKAGTKLSKLSLSAETENHKEINT